ncbi:spore germination protein [Bacillus sp. FJAT-45350]|uniref:spore germination protein n=1 Tax=Bacillus sp. FJAT-45350 TaxID=2011014 RepID=UPI000BB6A97E|nr:spore germination protein [Bacillus sp. FJAT-45350]
MSFKRLSKIQKNVQNTNQESIAETSNYDEVEPSLGELLYIFSDCADLEHKQYFNNEVAVLYFSAIIDRQKLEMEIIEPITTLEKPEDVVKLIKKKSITKAKSMKELTDEALNGSVILFFQNKAYYYNLYSPESRAVSQSETETVIVGAHDAFVEEATANISLIRKRIKSPKLKTVKIPVGEVTKIAAYVLYIEGIVDNSLVEELKTRITNIEMDSVFDTNMLAQLIDEKPDSLFPQYFNTELPDVVRSKLLAGKMAVILDGSPIVITAPTNFFEFVQSPDDYNQRWLIGTALRFLRGIAIAITITLTALYVAVITFHYEVLPEDLLITLAESRARVPFPPVFEALLMELTIELLREAGARLPTKVGQTIGIVGGIVIGQAAVDAGLTSNILIIAVATSAIASFVLPSYNMSNAIRIVRFGLIILAGFLGLFGIMIGLAFTIIHVTTLTSLKTPYLFPVSPFYWKGLTDTIIRGPYWLVKKRPTQTRTENEVRTKMKQ